MLGVGRPERNLKLKKKKKPGAKRADWLPCVSWLLGYGRLVGWSVGLVLGVRGLLVLVGCSVMDDRSAMVGCSVLVGDPVSVGCLALVSCPTLVGCPDQVSCSVLVGCPTEVTWLVARPWAPGKNLKLINAMKT